MHFHRTFWFALCFVWGFVFSGFSQVSTKALPPMMGWASWNHFRININEDIIKSQADQMQRLGMQKFGYSYINVDDGFFGGRDAQGKLLVHEKRFGSGMKSLAAYIHAKGLKAGIYSEAGINTCGSMYDKDTLGVGMGLFGHETSDLTLFLKDWDYDFIKVDWCGGLAMGLDVQNRYTFIAELARKIKPNVVLMCADGNSPANG